MIYNQLIIFFDLQKKCKKSITYKGQIGNNSSATVWQFKKKGIII